LRIADDAWTELQRSLYVQQEIGAPLSCLPDLSLEDAERRSTVGRSLLQRINALDLNTLPHDLALTLRLVRFRAEAWSHEADRYWMVIDPRGTGFFGMFLPTAYTGGTLLNMVHGRLASFSFENSGDTDRYLALLDDYARMIDEFATRTAGQAERGIRIPKVQIEPARALLQAFKSTARVAVGVAPQRLEAISSGNFATEVDRYIRARIEPAFDRAIEGLSDAYAALAPETVGIGQYPRGSDLYADLVKLHTTLKLTPEEVHALGLARMAEIQESMRKLRSEVGFKGDHPAFVANISEDCRWRADTVEGVAAVFQRYIDRLEPHLRKLFPVLPKATYGVAPLSEALEASMTFGFFDPPRSDRAHGVYLFNARNLTKQALFYVAALTYHELMPGHHMHLATQHDNEALHPFRKHSFVNAYNEGWAEYAGALAGEIGLYETPEERYGRLTFDAFLTCRLVVDTGMNVLGWTLEQGRVYMREHSGLSEREIITESLRYSCDRPAQALAYKLGDTRLLALRERMKRSLGVRFNLRDFHGAVLGPGALPLGDLEWHVECEIEGIKRQTGAQITLEPR
jgi:uncharacterized protein (DUF885 family)